MRYSFTAYQVQASFERDGQVIGCSSWEVLGDAANKHFASKLDAESEAADLQDSLPHTDFDPSTTYGVTETTHEIVIDPKSVVPFDGEPTNPYNAYCQMYLTLDGKRLCIGAMIGARESDHGSIKASGAGVVRAMCNVWWADSTDHQDVPAWAREAVEAALTKHSWELWKLVPEYEPEENETPAFSRRVELRADYDV